MYFVIGISFALTIYIFVMADHLWKERFFLTCLLIAAGQFLVGSVLEILGLTDMTPGIGFVVTSS